MAMRIRNGGGALDIAAFVGEYWSQLTSFVAGAFGGATVSFAYNKSIRASTGGRAEDKSRTKAAHDVTFGDKTGDEVHGDKVVNGDKIGRDKYTATNITVNK